MRPLMHCECGTLCLAGRGCRDCDRRNFAERLRAERAKERAERKRRAAERRRQREAAEQRRAVDAEQVAAMAGAFDGSRGLEPMGVHRFREHGGPRAFAAYERAYREARS